MRASLSRYHELSRPHEFSGESIPIDPGVRRLGLKEFVLVVPFCQIRPMGPVTAALVLAAGFGTRLAPLTDEMAKPTVPVGNRPLVLDILDRIGEVCVGPVAVNVHYNAEQVAALVQGAFPSVIISREERILGTAGGARQAAELCRAQSLVVVNGDIFGSLPLSALLEQASDGMLLAVVRRRLGEGTVGVDSQGRVVRLRGEIFGKEVASGDYMGVARLGPRCLSTLPRHGCLIGDWALPELRALRSVEAHFVESEFLDIGSLSVYLEANLRCVRSSGGTIRAPSARWESGVEVRSSVLGEDARIVGAGVVEESVVLPGAQAQAPLHRAVVTPQGRVIQL